MPRFDLGKIGKIIRIGIIPALAVIVTSSLAPAAPRVEPPRVAQAQLTADEIAARLMQAEEERRANLKEYSATRRYILDNKRFNKSAEMVVKALYRKDEGKTFQVLGITGSADVSKRVFDKLLDMECETSRNNKIDPSRITPDNYGFTLEGTEVVLGRPAYILQLKPKNRNKYLLDGRIWVDTRDFAIVRIDGRPAASLGFWVGRPHIVQTFEKHGDYWLSAENHSVSDTRLLGTTELKIVYSGYEFNVPEQVRVAMRQQPHRAREFAAE